MKVRKQRILLFGLLITMTALACACQKQQSATYNNKMNKAATPAVTDAASDSNIDTDLEADVDTNAAVTVTPVPTEAAGFTLQLNENAIVKGTGTYDCDISKDKEDFDPSSIDIVVGDKYYATQINDWYENFKDYDGKTVEIEGYYIDYSPYSFVGRFGPSCPYCQGGYVCFEFLTDEDLSKYVSDKDWIKVKGILRKGQDSEAGEFYYIEALSLEKMDQVGMDTVTN
jgi:uncharacterized membrane protein YcgQ (UPF0703/DUF1980 family)